MWCFDGIFKTTKFHSGTLYASRAKEGWEAATDIKWSSKGIAISKLDPKYKCRYIVCSAWKFHVCVNLN